MVFSTYTKQRILNLHWKGYKISSIVERLVLADQIVVSKQGVRQFLKHYHKYGTIARKPGSGLPSLAPAIQQLIEQTMQDDDETSATQLQAILASQGIYISLATIVRNRILPGWTYRGSAYCQLIRHQNKLKGRNGHVLTCTITSTTLSGVMKPPSSLKHTGVIATENLAKNLDPNHELNIQLRYMSGLG